MITKIIFFSAQNILASLTLGIGFRVYFNINEVKPPSGLILMLTGALLIARAAQEFLRKKMTLRQRAFERVRVSERQTAPFRKGNRL